MIEIEFERKYLEDLYANGKTKDKKHRFQPAIIKKYIRVIDTLKANSCIEDLYRFKSLNYEKLIGDKEGLESVRVNDQYRIEFKSRTEGEEPHAITICSIVELSNHYK